MPVTDWATATTATGADWTPDSGTLVSAMALLDAVKVSMSHTGTTSLVLGGFETSPGTALALPANAIPEGLEVVVGGWYYDGAVLGNSPTIGVRCSKDGVTPIFTAKDFEVGPNTNPITNATLGGPGDLWGGGWTDVEMEGLYLFLNRGATNLESPAVGRMLDYLKLRVYYSEPVVVVPGIIDAGLRYVPGYSQKGGQGSLKRG